MGVDDILYAGGDHSASLLERYRAYRRAQGRELLTIIPREGVRSLLRTFEPSSPDDGDVLDELAARCSELLPLPPFDVWARDFHEARAEYESLPGPPLAPESPDGEAVTVEVRSIAFRQSEWVAALALRAHDDQWVGHVRFHPSSGAQVYTTGDIFRESSPLQVRERFRSFDDGTLNAFLRSALP